MCKGNEKGQGNCKCGGTCGCGHDHHQGIKEGRVRLSSITKVKNPIDVGLYEPVEAQMDADSYADALYSNLMDENDLLRLMVSYEYKVINKEKSLDGLSKEELHKRMEEKAIDALMNKWSEGTFIKKLMAIKMEYKKVFNEAW